MIVGNLFLSSRSMLTMTYCQDWWRHLDGKPWDTVKLLGKCFRCLDRSILVKGGKLRVILFFCAKHYCSMYSPVMHPATSLMCEAGPQGMEVPAI